MLKYDERYLHLLLLVLKTHVRLSLQLIVEKHRRV